MVHLLVGLVDEFEVHAECPVRDWLFVLKSESDCQTPTCVPFDTGYSSDRMNFSSISIAPVKRSS